MMAKGKRAIMTRTIKTAVFLLILIPACAGARHPSSGLCARNPTDKALISGSVPPILAPLLGKWRAELSGTGLSVETGPPGPPQGALDPGLAAFLDGKRDFAFLTREIAEEDLARFRRAHGTDPVVIPVAGGSWTRFGYVDPVVMIVNAANPIRSLSFAQIDAIFSTSRLRGYTPITDWGQAGVAGWQGRPIRLVGGDAWASAESARALTVRRWVLSVGNRVGTWREASGTGSEADNVERVVRDPLAIAFTGAGHVLPGTRVVPVMVKAGGRPVMPTRDAVANGRYPLSRTVDLVVARRPDGTIAPQVARFAGYLLSKKGQDAVEGDDSFLPLTRAQLLQARRMLRTQPSC